MTLLPRKNSSALEALMGVGAATPRANLTSWQTSSLSSKAPRSSSRGASRPKASLRAGASVFSTASIMATPMMGRSIA